MSRYASSRLVLSAEQSEIVYCPQRTVLVSAGAGTGKTSTLEVYAAARPRMNILYLAFNKEIRSEAMRRFPRNVHCKTTHGMAFPHFGEQYKAKLSNPKPYHIAGVFGIPLVTAGMVLAGVLRWLASADDVIDDRHFPEAEGFEIHRLVDIARRAWKVMSDPSARAIPICHDAYLKLYQLSKPVLDYDVILFDEAQDANAAVLDIINRQNHCIRVFVGDRRQAIYAFRGAVNAMDMVQADVHLQLTGSYRYGQGVADVANELLRAYTDAPLRLRGLVKDRTRFGVDDNSAHTLLARTNAGLFSAAVDIFERNQPFSFIGGAGSYRFNSLIDADLLRRGQFKDIRDPFLRAFDSYSLMREYAEAVEDGELWSLMSVVDRYGDALPSLVSSLMKGNASCGGPVVSLATAHRAKGLEWPAIRLHHDFTDMRCAAVEGGGLVAPEAEEVNLLYVAVTRAKESIAIHPPLLSWLGEQNPSLHGDIMQGQQRLALVPKVVSGIDFGQPSLDPETILGPKGMGILRDAPAMIAASVDKCDPAVLPLMKLVFDLTHHLITGELRLSSGSALAASQNASPADPAPTQRQIKRKASVARANATLDPAAALPLWMLGKSLESISEQLSFPVKAVIDALSRTLVMSSEEVLTQNAARSA